VCPGDPNYLFGSPLFDKATIHLTNGKDFTIVTQGNGPQKFYIEGATLNGEAWNKVFIGHDQIVCGGQLLFNMASFPNYHWAVGLESRPASAIMQIK
jgi:putative alpha-1,2-mannosidase